MQENVKVIDKMVKQIYKRFKTKGKPTFSKLKSILGKAGYVTNSYTNEHIEVFGDRVPPAYTYELNDNKMILYNDALSENDLVIAFAHELGHIALCHMHRHSDYEDTSTYQEYEANIFAYRFLNYHCIRRKKMLFAMVFALCPVVSVILSYFIGCGA